MAKARRKLRRQLMKKAKKGYLTPGEREDLMQLDREVNKANRQAAAVGVPALSAALAMASRSGALSGMGDSLSGFLAGMGERREGKEEEGTPVTQSEKEEMGLLDQSTKDIQDIAREELVSSASKELEERQKKNRSSEGFVPADLQFEKTDADIKREQDEKDRFEGGYMDENAYVLDEAVKSTPSYGLSGNREVAREKFIRDLQENNPELLEKYGKSRYDKYGNYINIGQSTLDPEIYNLVQQGDDEYRFSLKPEFGGPQPTSTNPSSIETSVDQAYGGYTPFLSRLRNKFQKRLTGRR